jgi:hypothetical protein
MRATRPSDSSAGSTVTIGASASSAALATKRGVVEGADVAALEGAQRKQVEGDSAAERRSRNTLEVHMHVDDRLLDADGEDYDSSHHRQV